MSDEDADGFTFSTAQNELLSSTYGEAAQRQWFVCLSLNFFFSDYILNYIYKYIYSYIKCVCVCVFKQTK